MLCWYNVLCIIYKLCKLILPSQAHVTVLCHIWENYKLQQIYIKYLYTRVCEYWFYSYNPFYVFKFTMNLNHKRLFLTHPYILYAFTDMFLAPCKYRGENADFHGYIIRKGSSLGRASTRPASQHLPNGGMTWETSRTHYLAVCIFYLASSDFCVTILILH